MNNTLTAKEWLEKEGLKVNPNTPLVDNVLSVMEKYANYKNRILEDRIKEFRKILKEQVDTFSNVYDDAEISFLNEYDKHFNINKETIKEWRI